MISNKRLKGELKQTQQLFPVTVLAPVPVPEGGQQSLVQWHISLRGGYVLLSFPPNYPFEPFTLVSTTSSAASNGLSEILPLSRLVGFSNESILSWTSLPEHVRWNTFKTVSSLFALEPSDPPTWIDNKYGIEEWRQTIEVYSHLQKYPELFCPITDPSSYFDELFMALVAKCEDSATTIEELLQLGTVYTLQYLSS
jgi:hypothetical protein